ncbi:MAG: Murein DD-endopeptidase MepM [Firmicutes bacterium]|nr:Murein DD-endopeptidase MepM [Bacillota bacterium]MBT9157109.1 Murein DD-endopeptidase MepM [Bacillota bacterium]
MVSNKKQEKEFTLMIIPHGDEETYAMRMPYWWLHWGGIALVVLFISSISLIYSLRQTKLQLANYHGLMLENRQQQEHILFLAKQTTELQTQLQEIQALDTSIREMMKLGSSRVTTSARVQPTLAIAQEGVTRAQLTNRSLSLAATLLRTEQSIESIKEALPETEDSLKGLEQQVGERRAKEEATPSLWPVEGDITSGFGLRRSPFGAGREFHAGIDIAAPRGTPVHATAAGTVRMASFNGGYGNVVFVDHGFGFSTVYAHLSRISVRVGQEVAKGQLVGLVGSTGRSTAPHLHYEVRVGGTTVNPMRFLEAR